MALNFWHRTLIASLIVTVLVGLFSAVYFDLVWAKRYTLVSLWTVGNFWLLGQVLRKVTVKSSAWTIALWTVLKIALWYVVGYLILSYAGAERTSLLAGFHTFFVVLILRTLGRQLMRPDTATRDHS